MCAELLGSALPGAAVLGMVESKAHTDLRLMNCYYLLLTRLMATSYTPLMQAKAKNWGHTILAIDPSILTENYPEKAESVLQTVKATSPDIRLPGERSSTVAAKVEEAGSLVLPTKLWASLQKHAAKQKCRL